AAGEAYDKVARMLDLPYPGGPQIDRLAKKGKESIAFPRAWLEEDSFDFSFSGLKSAVINKIHNAKQRDEALSNEDIAASFQVCCIDILTQKTMRAVRIYKVKLVILVGGVAANSGLRDTLSEIFTSAGIPLMIRPLHVCPDN